MTKLIVDSSSIEDHISPEKKAMALTKAKNVFESEFSLLNKDSSFYKVIFPYKKDKWIVPYLDVSKQIAENFTNIIIIGMGGAILNPKAFLSFANASKKPSVSFYYLDTTDPINFANLFETLNLTTTAVITISNSGETLETIALTKAVINEFKIRNINIGGNNFFYIIGKGNSALRTLAEEIDGRIFDHESNISGRFAGLTNITTIPALIAGYNAEELLTGANSVISDFWQNKENSLAVQGASLIFALEKSILVNISYISALGPFLAWNSQIVAESLGKRGIGYTPLYGLGPNDQHSMLQLYLDGPKDKLCTLLTLENLGDGLQESKIFFGSHESQVSNITLADIHRASFNATVKALRENDVSTRSITIKNLSEESIGALMAFSMLEVIMLGHLMGVNPFDQNSVEIIKLITKQHINVA